MSIFRRVYQLYNCSKSVKNLHGKPIKDQLSEIIALYFSPSKLGVSEYYEYGVFDDKKLTYEKKLEMIGWKTSSYIDKKLNTTNWRSVANNKLLCHAILNGLNIPTPINLAVYSKSVTKGNNKLISDVNALRDFLSDKSIYPIFLKPVQGTYGKDNYAVVGYDSSADRIILSNGDFLKIENLSKKMDFPPYGGYLLQPLLKPHPILKKICGDRLSTVRLILIRQENGFEPFIAFWKIPVGLNMTDNFSHGATGNMLGWVEIGTGEVIRVVPKLGIDRVELETHPDTHQRLLGLAIPDWEDAKNLCLKAAGILDGLWLQHWDIAFTDKGPVILEVNTEADLGVPQGIGYMGILNEKMRNALELKEKFNAESRKAILSRD